MFIPHFDKASFEEHLNLLEAEFDVVDKKHFCTNGEPLRDLHSQDIKLEVGLRIDASKLDEVHVTNLSSKMVTSESQVWKTWKHQCLLLCINCI